MNALIGKVANAAKEYTWFRDRNASVLASANDRFEKGVVVAAGALNAVAAATISVATVSAAKQANGLLAKSGKYIAGIYLCEYFAVGIESLAVLTIEVRRDIKKASKANGAASFAAKLEAEVAELRAAREAREAEMHVSRMALEREIREGRRAAEERWMAIATTGGNLLDVIAEQPLDWLRPLTADQEAAYEKREEERAANQD